ncbi:MAG: type II toxin-antitoxin system VapC family toxin [Scytolyngbya sp. HA4215-MV1]|nr:type II toxin-antitoxin system VapC family toxin [Scytolyngbya sp. HA4215-MV1]
MGSRYLLDTNIFIYYFNGDPVVQPIVEDILTGNSTGFYCPVSWVELLCYPALTEEEAEQIRAFLRSLTYVALTESVLDRTAQIRRDYRTALPDALIAACALEVSSPLVTRNIQDFRAIHELIVINPFEL